MYISQCKFLYEKEKQMIKRITIIEGNASGDGGNHEGVNGNLCSSSVLSTRSILTCLPGRSTRRIYVR